MTVLEDFISKKTGYRKVIRSATYNIICGYVGIPFSHKMSNIDYDAIDADVHGGLTFSDENLPEVESEDTWWFGFDFGHVMDLSFLWNRDIEARFPSSREILENLDSLEYRLWILNK